MSTQLSNSQLGTNPTAQISILTGSTGLETRLPPSQRVVMRSNNGERSSTDGRNVFTRSNLTDLQLLYWVGQRLRPESPLFNNILAFTLNGQIQPDWFIQAFETVVAASDALRTIIVETEQTPERIVLPETQTRMQFVDLSEQDDPDLAAQLWMQTHSRQPMDMSQRLYDSALLKLTPEKFIWYLNQHHLITDATSIFLIFEHVTAVYNQLTQQNRIPQLKLPPFEDYVTAKKISKSAPRAQRAMAFWQDKLAGLPKSVNNGRLTTTHTTRHTTQLSPAQSQRFHNLAAQKEFASTTPDLSHFNVLAALMFAHLYQVTGEQKLGFVTTVHDRPTRPRRQTIGVLMELCPLTAVIRPGESFASLIKQVAADMKQVLIHYRYGATAVLRDHVMDVMLNFNFRPSLTFQGQPVRQAIVHPGCGSEKFALHIHYFEETGSYELYFDFNNEAYSASSQKAVIAAFMELFDALLDDPNQPIESFRLTEPATKQSEPELENGRPAYTPPRTITEQQVQQVWQNVLGQNNIGIHDDFFALGGDSIKAMDLFVQLEAATGQYLPMSTLLSANTIADMAQAIEGEQPDNPAVVLIQAGDREKRPFFFIPGAAGNTLVVDRICRHLSQDQPVYSFNMPGLVDGQTPLTSIEALAAYYLNGIQSIQPAGPYLLGGYSAGSIIALEVAQQLHDQGEEVLRLVNVDMPIENPRLHHLRDGLKSIGQLFNLSPKQQQNLFLRLRDWLVQTRFFFHFTIPHEIGYYRGRWRYFRGLSPGQRRQFLLSKLNLAEFERPEGEPSPGIPQATGDMDAGMLTDPRVQNVYHVTDRAVRYYLPKPYAGKVTLLRCPPGYGRVDLRSPFPTMGWDKVASDVDLRIIPAKGHLDIVQEPHIQTLGQAIQACLDQIQTQPAHSLQTENT